MLGPSGGIGPRRVRQNHITKGSHAPRDAGVGRGAELPREEGPARPREAEEGDPRGTEGGGKIPRTRRGHERGLLVAGKRPRDDEGARPAHLPTRAARRGSAALAGTEGSEGVDQSGRSRAGPETPGRVSVRRGRSGGRPRMASPEGMGGGLERSPRERRDPHASGERSGRQKRAGRRAPRPTREGRATGGRHRSPAPPRPEVPT